MSSPKLTALFLSLLLAAPGGLPAQQAQPEPAPVSSPDLERRVTPGSLRILVLEGQGAVNSVIARSAISPVVQILDSQDQPVPGATVTFAVPPMGPGGAFGSDPVATVRSDVNGQATALFTPNKTSGAFTIQVTATVAGQSATTAIRQRNDGKLTEAMLPLPPKPWFKNWKWWAAIGAGAGAGVAASVILSNRSRTPTITLSTGPVFVGGPR